jgi:hypothetical protein
MRRAFAFVMLCLVTIPALAQRYSSAEFDQAWAALQRRDCKAAWDIIWPLAKRGDPWARHFLYNSLAAGGMVFPGITKDHSWYYRSYLMVAVYAAVTPEDQLAFPVPDRRFFRVDIINVIKSAERNSNGERVAQCYAAGSSFQNCLDLGTSLGVFPTFDDFAQETDEAERRTGVAAHCAPRY